MRAMRRWSSRVMAAALAAGAIACGAPACDDLEERIAADVEILVRDDGRLGEGARARLIARGRFAIAHLEPALYRADAAGRCRVLRALAALRTTEVEPILSHVRVHDPDASVRECAARESARLP